MRKTLLIFLLLLIGLVAEAQIAVKSFRALPTDMTASSLTGKRIDQNGNVAALIKVVTAETGFTFEGGTLGIVDTKQENGEIWVWVPHSLRKMTVKHQRLGVLRDYFFPVTIEAERTYEMVLVTGKVETKVTPAVTQQFLVFNVTPSDAKVTVDGQPWPVRGGVASKLVDFGQHTYSVESPDHHPSAGKIEVSNPDDKVVIEVTLKKAYGFVKIEGDRTLLSQASVYIDNANGAEAIDAAWKLSSGKHKVQVVHPLYKPFEELFSVNDGETYTVQVVLAANYAEVTLSVDDDAEIWVDGEKKGLRTWTGPLLEGKHTVACRKEGCHERVAVKTLTTAMSGQIIQLESPTPFTGRLVVNSLPAMARLFIDGKDMKETPIQINEIDVGEHQLRLEKEGFLMLTKTFTIEADMTLNLDLEMEEIVQKPKVEVVSPSPNNTMRFVTLNYAYNPVASSFGAAVGTLGNIGWFASVMSNFSFKAAGYAATADDDGLVDGEMPGYDGTSMATRLSVIGGVTLRVMDPLYVRAGLGYGIQLLSCGTNSGTLVRWPDGSVQGVEVTAGVQLRLNRFTLSLDGVSTGFKTLEAKVGVGVCF